MPVQVPAALITQEEDQRAHFKQVRESAEGLTMTHESTTNAVTFASTSVLDTLLLATAGDADCYSSV